MAEALKPAIAPRVMIVVAEFEPVLLVVDALSTIPEGLVPLVKSEPHSVCKSLANVDAVLGKSSLRTLYASFMQLEQVILEGMPELEVVNAFSMTLAMLLMLRVPRMAWMLVSVSVTQFVFESVRQMIFLAVE